MCSRLVAPGPPSGVPTAAARMARLGRRYSDSFSPQVIGETGRSSTELASLAAGWVSPRRDFWFCHPVRFRLRAE